MTKALTTVCWVCSEDVLTSFTSCSSIECDKSYDHSVLSVFTRCASLFYLLFFHCRMWQKPWPRCVKCVHKMCRPLLLAVLPLQNVTKAMTMVCQMCSQDVLPSLTSCSSIAECDKSHDHGVSSVFTRCAALSNQLFFHCRMWQKPWPRCVKCVHKMCCPL